MASLDKEAHDKLNEELKTLPYGRIPLRSGYEGVDEESFFICGISYDKAFEIANRYNQQSMIWKDKDFFGIVFTTDFTESDGTHHTEHERGIKFKTSTKEGITFDPSILKYAYSTFKRSNSNQRKKFAFQVEEKIEWGDDLYEKIVPGRTEIMIHRKLDFGYQKIT